MQSRCLASMQRFPHALEAAENAWSYATELEGIVLATPDHPQVEQWKRILAPYHAQIGYGYANTDSEKAQAALREALDWAEGDDLLQGYRDQWTATLNAIQSALTTP